MSTKWLFYAAAATTVTAGILHLWLAPSMLNLNPNAAALFFAGGIAQLFWAVPMIRRWGKIWYSAGIGGTVICCHMDRHEDAGESHNRKGRDDQRDGHRSPSDGVGVCRSCCSNTGHRLEGRGGQ